MAQIPTIKEQFLNLFGTSIAEQGAELKFMCPKCKKKALFCNMITGLYHCFYCQYGQGCKPVQGAAVANIIPKTEVNLEKQIEVINKLIDLFRPSYTIYEYLQVRGIINPYKYKFGEVPYNAVAQLLKHFSEEELLASGLVLQGEKGLYPAAVLKPRRILIPHWQGDKVVGLKSRLRPYVRDEEVDEPRFAAARNNKSVSGLWYYGKPKTKSIIVTEGELKAAVSTDHVMFSCALPGISNARRKESIIQLQEFVDLHDIEQVYLVFDSDKEPAPDFYKSVRTLAKSLKEKSCIVTLPQNKNKDKVDLDSFIVDYGVDELWELLYYSWRNREQILDGFQRPHREESSSNSKKI